MFLRGQEKSSVQLDSIRPLLYIMKLYLEESLSALVLVKGLEVSSPIINTYVRIYKRDRGVDIQ